MIVYNNKKQTKKEKHKQLGDFLTRNPRNPNTPKPVTHRVKPVEKSTSKEAEVLSNVISLLKRLNVFYIRRSVGLFFTAWGQHVSVGCAGEGDIETFLPNGIYCYLECKSGKGGVLSVDQIRFKEKIERLGGKYFSVCSAKEAYDYLMPYLPTDPLFEGCYD